MGDQRRAENWPTGCGPHRAGLTKNKALFALSSDRLTP